MWNVHVAHCDTYLVKVLLILNFNIKDVNKIKLERIHIWTKQVPIQKFHLLKIQGVTQYYDAKEKFFATERFVLLNALCIFRLHLILFLFEYLVTPHSIMQNCGQIIAIAIGKIFFFRQIKAKKYYEQNDGDLIDWMV